MSSVTAAPFFLRFTRRGGPGAGFGGGTSASGCAPSSSVLAFAGVRDERFCVVGGATFGIRRRVMSPWPTVQRFVVIQ